MTLKRGHFFLSSHNGVRKVYVQPTWMGDNDAFLIAKGVVNVAEIPRPDIPEIAPAVPSPQPSATFDDTNPCRETAALREQFDSKIRELERVQQEQYQQIMKSIQDRRKAFQDQFSSIALDEPTIVNQVLQKVNAQQSTRGPPVNEEQLVQKVLARIPTPTGNVVYAIAPLEKIKKDFLQRAKDKVYGDVAALDAYQKQALKFVETQGKGCTLVLILEKCFHLSGSSGGSRQKLSENVSAMAATGLMRKDKNSTAYPGLKERIKELIEPFGGTD